LKALYYPETDETTCLQVGVSLVGQYNRAFLNYVVGLNSAIRRDSASPTLGIFLSGSENKVCLQELPFLEPEFMVEEDGSVVRIQTQSGNFSDQWTVCNDNGIRTVTTKLYEVLTVVILEPQRRQLL
jgi:hypothetical protein